MKKFIVAAVFVGALAFAGSANAAFTWTPGQSLIKVGSRGAQVMDLQACLATLGHNPNSNIDGVFGPITANAVMQFQASKGVAVDGIIGPVTGPLYEAACAMAGEDDEESSDTSSFDTTDGEEASLESYSMQSEDDAEEGEMKHVATVEFDVEDGDFLMERFDLTFEFAGGGTADDEPWDVFDTLTLMVDGDEIAEEDIDDEDDWNRDNSPFVFRLKGLDYVVEDGDTVEIEVYLTAQNNVDDLANADWEIYVAQDGIRGVDTAGLTQYIGDASTPVDVVAFDVDAEGGDEAIDMKSSSNNPDASTLLVDADNDSEWHEVLIFKLEAEENDIDLEDLDLTVTTATEVYNLVVDDAKIEIDGDEFDDFTVADPATTTADLTFDIDKDFTIDADDTVEVVVFLKFRDSATYTPGTTTVQVTATDVSGEGVDDVSDTATILGETHTLSLSVADLSDVDESVEADDPNDSGTISWTFTITAEEDDIVFGVVDNDAVNGATDDVMFTVLGTDTGIAVSQLTLVSGDAAYAGGDWTINEGEDATFVLDTTLTTVDAADNGVYRVRLDSVAGTTVDQTSTPGLSLSF